MCDVRIYETGRAAMMKHMSTIHLKSAHLVLSWPGRERIESEMKLNVIDWNIYMCVCGTARTRDARQFERCKLHENFVRLRA